MLTVAFDQDAVLANLNSKWLTRYNNDYNDNLKEEDLRQWGVHEFTKPECDSKIYNYLSEEGFYRDLPVIEGSQEVVSELVQKGYKVCVASASPKKAFTDKYEWVKNNFKDISPDNIIFTKNKSLVNAHILIDDGVHNLESFQGLPVLFDTPWNKEEKRYIRVNNWKEIENFFDMIDELIASVKYNIKESAGQDPDRMEKNVLETIIFTTLTMGVDKGEIVDDYYEINKESVKSQLKIIEGGKKDGE